MLHRLFTLLLGLAFVALVLISPPPHTVVRGGAICATPDGFTVAGNDKGLGGTGLRFADRKGIGGTGISGSIGVYGRITGFASICVNGMEIHYKKETSVRDMGRSSSTEALRVGQMVAVEAVPGKNGFQARMITIEKAVSGSVTQVDPRAGTLTVQGQMVHADREGRTMLAALRKGDTVAVSGLRRADGSLLASRIEKTQDKNGFVRKSAGVSFARGVRHFSIQGYVKAVEKDGWLLLTDGTKILLPVSRAIPAVNGRVILFGVIDNGLYKADHVVTEHAGFTASPAAVLQGSAKGGLVQVTQGMSAMGSAAESGLSEISLPSTDSISLPAVNLPPVEVPGLPAVNVPSLPPVNLPAIPPVTVPTIPPVNLPSVPPVNIPALPPVTPPPVPPVLPPVLPVIH